ncbi:unnamed protein product [Bathycoccus prasinos]
MVGREKIQKSRWQDCSSYGYTFPGIGEVVGGSQREERLDVLKARMTEMDVEHAESDQDLDLRRFGGNKHAKFRPGFERIVLFITRYDEY